MTLSSATSNSMVVTWTVGASSGTSAATAYKVGWTEGGTGRTWVSSAPHYPLSSSPLTLTGLIVNTACNVTVTPLNSAGEGIQTTRMLSTTAAEAPPPTDSLPAKVVGGYYPKSPRKNKLNNFCCSPLAHCGCLPLAVLALRRVRRLALHPAASASMSNLFLRDS
ncbi:MAG TPA: fibronectin type III domain-containing protein [Noviherbaspirillum sp.]|nr:fibronectin type III domain-containing protein [Noviherbaspirillum sp.]